MIRVRRRIELHCHDGKKSFFSIELLILQDKA